MTEYTHIIWDWNGTLLNDVNASLSSVNDMLDMRGMPHIDLDFYKECIGVPIRKFYDRVFDMEKEDYSIIIKQYNEGYLRHLADCGLTDGAREAIEFFASCGMHQAVVSSSNNDQLCMNIRKYGLEDCFEAVLGSADYYAGSKIDRARDYLAKTGAENGGILVIGDLEHDADMAKELGADCVLLTSGHEHISRLRRADARLIDDLHALIDCIK
ncbi:MAG: HAD family hydrolase [Clostridia bacterium]|nr:HAD family hydrolase [Clostridia bacterium]MBQ3007226.1 HAD family hydrolase [Clostridia bacterium]MBQ3044378.1 HAD family hydrolase [Clostridia bacterium]